MPTKHSLQQGIYFLIEFVDNDFMCSPCSSLHSDVFALFIDKTPSGQLGITPGFVDYQPKQLSRQ
ncbi:MAG: hypothetical protein GF350_11355 [Chitinivibrionales bacterium]|nr:hypothetical protein [Chitinivibrionales bacterium]